MYIPPIQKFKSQVPPSLHIIVCICVYTVHTVHAWHLFIQYVYIYIYKHIYGTNLIKVYVSYHLAILYSFIEQDQKIL